MTLWRRISDGVWLCATVAAAMGLAWLIMAIELPIAKIVGFWLWVIVGSFGGIFFGIGALIVIGGTLVHLRDTWRKRSHA